MTSRPDGIASISSTISNARSSSPTRETPSKVIPMESDDYNMSDPIAVPVPAVFDIVDE